MTEPCYTLVDICWTLFRSNTTFDFLDSLVTARGYRLLRRIGRTRLGRASNLLFYKIFRTDLQRTLCLRYLKGYSRACLEEKAEDFYRSYLVPRRIDAVWERLPERNLVLVSGTLDVIAATVARHLGAEAYHSSELEYRNGICTGRLRSDFLQRKATLATAYPSYNVITDNTGDIALVRNARQAVIVTYGNRKRWQRLTHRLTDITFIHATGTAY